MSEVANPEGINININNSDSSEGGNSLIDRIFNIGFKVLIPVGLIIALGGILLIFTFVIPLLETVYGAFSDFGGGGVGGFLSTAGRFILGPVGPIVTGLGVLVSWTVGR